MNAGVLRSRYRDGAQADVEKVYREVVLPGYSKIDGARGGQLWVNAGSREMLSIGFYDDEAAARAFQPVADEALKQLEPYTEDRGEREFFTLSASTGLETEAVIRATYDAFNAHDAEAIARLTAPDYRGSATGAPPVEGVQGAKAYNQAWFTAFPDCVVTIDRITTLGRFGTVEGTFSGTHAGPMETSMGTVPATGRKTTGPFVDIIEVDRGLVRSNHLMYDRMTLAEQLGLLPASPVKQQV